LGGGSIEDYGLFWARWYASNALGSLTLGPIAMICIESTTRPRFAPAGRAVEAVIIAALLVAACIVAFEDLPSIASGYLPLLLYLPLLIIVWAAVRFGAKGASGSIFVISVALIWRTLNGPSLFASAHPKQMSSAWLFLIGLSPPILLLGSAIEETRRAERTTRESEERISFAAASSNVGLWQYEFATGAFWRQTTAGHCSDCLRASP
jgi:integral membrane sensor domain MASE1